MVKSSFQFYLLNYVNYEEKDRFIQLSTTQKVIERKIYSTSQILTMYADVTRQNRDIHYRSN
jgi:hypothetical protein